MEAILRKAGIPGIAAVCMAILAGSQCSAVAQELDDPWRLWGAVGGGLSSDAVNAMGELVFQKGPHQITARAVAMGDPYGAEGGMNSKGEFGLLYGRTAMSRHGHLSFSAGLAVTDTDMDSEQGMTLGVPLVAEGAFRIVSFLGIGAQVFGNLNANESYSGFTLFLQFGYMPAVP